MNKNTIYATKMNIIPQMSSSDIKILKDKTSHWMTANNINPNDEMCIAKVPADLLCIDTYQLNRFAASGNGIKSILADYNPNRVEPIQVNYRLDGTLAGLLFVYNGQHRVQVDELRNASGTWARFVSMPANEECLLFGNQDNNITKVPAIDKYNAWLACTNMLDNDVRAAYLTKQILDKYGLNPNEQRIALTECHSITKKDIIANQMGFEWVIEILKKSNVYNTHRGLSADMMSCLYKVYKDILAGKYQSLTPTDVKPVLIKKLKNNCWATITSEGLHDAPSTTHIQASDRRKRAKAVFRKWIVDAFSSMFPDE